MCLGSGVTTEACLLQLVDAVKACRDPAIITNCPVVARSETWWAANTTVALCGDDGATIIVVTKMRCLKRLGRRIVVRDFDRQVAEIQVRIIRRCRLDQWRDMAHS